MRYIAAYLLLQIGGNASPSAADIKKVLAAGSVDVDESRLDSLISELEGKDINQLIAEGSSKLASVRVHPFTTELCNSPIDRSHPVEDLLPLLLVVPLPQLLPPRRRRRRRRKRRQVDAFVPQIILYLRNLQEESDDDMGFGLFD